jgi:hypothetical protein
MEGAVQRWEYQTWWLEKPGNPEYNGGQLSAIDGEYGSTRRNLIAALDQAGIEGWELVGMGVEANRWTYTFKRPKA